MPNTPLLLYTRPDTRELMRRRWRLSVIDGDDRGTTAELEESPALIGAAPPRESHPTEEEIDRFVSHAARMLSLALTSFNGGIRSFYFALAWLAWFVHPIAFIAATALMVAVLYKRQISSRSQQAIWAYLEILERK